MPSPEGIVRAQGSISSFFRLLHWQAGSLPLVPPGKPTRCPGEIEANSCTLILLRVLWRTRNLKDLAVFYQIVDGIF